MGREQHFAASSARSSFPPLAGDPARARPAVILRDLAVKLVFVV